MQIKIVIYFYLIDITTKHKQIHICFVFVPTIYLMTFEAILSSNNSFNLVLSEMNLFSFSFFLVFEFKLSHTLLSRQCCNFSLKLFLMQTLLLPISLSDVILDTLTYFERIN